MKNYSVIVTRDTTESTVVYVQAEDKENAADLALVKAKYEPCDWEVNEGNFDRPYLGDTENDVAEIVDAKEIPNIRCDNCGLMFTESQIIPLEDVKMLNSRLDPGSIVPAGECKKCGALCYLPFGKGGATE